ncbi:ICAL protein, partial [Alcedo cyanopectus]|nr:ICAL protein [Ceyx cyanopectus]
EDVSSRYLEELGKREGSLPPDYVKLLKSKGDGKDGVPPKMDEQDEKPMTDYELAEALSSDFTCHAASAEGKKTSLTEKPREEGEIIQAQAASSVKTSASPKENNTKSEEEMKDDAVEALLDTLGGPEPEPPQDLTPVVEVAEAIAKEKKEEKVGERDDTILPEYRLTPELDKDGKPVFPKPEEKPQALSELDLVDEFSKDFSCSAQPASQSKSRSASKKPLDLVSAKATKDEAVPCVTTCIVQSSAPPDLSSVKGGMSKDCSVNCCTALLRKGCQSETSRASKEKESSRKKNQLYEDYTGDGWNLIHIFSVILCASDDKAVPFFSENEGGCEARSENDLLEGLMEGFSCSPSPSAALLTPTGTKKMKEGVKPAGSKGTISAATVSSVQAAAPLASTSGGKEVDEALDLLSDSLGQREPNPDENKPVVDKVKEKAKSEHRDKLGERDDTIPPDYQKLLESGEQGEPVKPTAKGDVKHKEQKMPADDSAAIDALSGDFDTCAKAPATPKRSKGKSGKEAVTTKPAPKDRGELKDHKTARGQSSSSKPEKQKTS